MKRRNLLKAIPAALVIPFIGTEAESKEIPVDLEKVECEVKYGRALGKHCSFLLCPDCGRELFATNGGKFPLLMGCDICEIRLYKASVASNESGSVKVEYYKHNLILHPKTSD